MALEDGVFNRLANYAGLAALIGGTGDSARVYPNKTPDKPTAPYVVFELDDDDDPEQRHAMGVDIVIKRAQGRFYCFAATGDSARSVSDQVVAALTRYSGTNAGVTFHDCYIRGNRPAVDDDAKLQSRLVEFQIVYQE